MYIFGIKKYILMNSITIIVGVGGKWAPHYEGSFVVKRAFSRGALVLTNMDGEELPSPVNSDVVKLYYA